MINEDCPQGFWFRLQLVFCEKLIFKMMKNHALVLIMYAILPISLPAKILGLLPFYGTSHNLVTMPFLEELANRGHEVIIAGFYRPKHPSSNVKSILFEQTPGRLLRGFLTTENFVNSDHMSAMYLCHDILQQNDAAIDQNLEKYSEILKEEYDLVILEYFESDLFSSFVAKLGAPFIIFRTAEPLLWHRDALGDPISPSLIPHVFSKYGREGMNFYERFWNTLEVFQMMFYYKAVMLPMAQKIAEKYFRSGPNVDSLMKNASLYFTNTHSSWVGPRPMNPSTVEVGGINIFPPDQLPKVNL